MRKEVCTVWTIYPLDVGDLEHDRSEAIFRRGMGERGTERFVACYLTGGTSPVVVDTGPPDDAHSRKWHPSPVTRIWRAFPPRS